MADYSYLNNVPVARIHKRNAKQVNEDSKEMLRWYERKVLALASSSGQNMKDAEGNDIFWPDFIVNELDCIFEDYKDFVLKEFFSRYIIDNPEDIDDELERQKDQVVRE